MDIQCLAVSEINAAPYNPRRELRPGDAAYEQLVASVDQFGLVQPLVWNRRTGHLVGGHQRLSVLRARGVTEVTVSVVDLPLAKEKRLNLALNKVQGEWDRDLLTGLLSEIAGEGEFDFTGTGFELNEVEDLLAGLTDGDAAEGDGGGHDESVAPDGEPVTRPGELVTLGAESQFRLLCGDATDSSVVAELLGNERAHLVHTDPPYGVRYDPAQRPGKRGWRPASGAAEDGEETSGGGGRMDRPCNDDLAPKRYAAFFGRVVDVLAEALIPGGAYYIWNGHAQFGLMADLLRARGFKVRSVITWDKGRFSPGFGDYQEQTEFCLYGHRAPAPGRGPGRGVRRRWYGPKNASTLWRVDRDPMGQYVHPTQKALSLVERAIRHGSQRGELVFDPFLGGGTTLIAAARLGRRCAGLEIEPRYCDAVVRRYIALAGESAVAPELAERYQVHKPESEGVTS